jgi:phosphatidylserine synthase
MVVVPALLMVSTIRFRSVKAIDLGWRRSYVALFILAIGLALIASHPRIALVVLAYGYTAGALIAWAFTRFRRRPGDALASETPSGAADPHPISPTDSTARLS